MPYPVRLAALGLLAGLILVQPLAARAATPPVPAPAADAGLAGRAQELITKTKQALKAGDLRTAAACVRGLRALAQVAPPGSVPADLMTTAIGLRKDVSRAGGPTEDWETWGYDGKQPGAAIEQVRAIEKQIAAYRTEVAQTDIHRAHKALVDLKSHLGQKAFTKDPVLSYFRSEVASPAIIGINQFHGQQVAAQIADYIRLAQDAFALHEMDKTIAYVRMAHNYYDLLRSTDLHQAPYQLKLANGTVGLDEAMHQGDTLMQRSEADIARAKADETARDRLWRSLLHGDKMKLYEQYGPPSMWEVTDSEWAPEDAAKAKWWRYFETLDAHNKRQTTYTFDANDAIVDTQKEDVYIPF